MVSRKQRRSKRQKKGGQRRVETAPQPIKQARGRFDTIYHDEYKKLLIIPFIILLLALAQISFQYATTGDFLNKGVSLTGGLTLTIPVDGQDVTVDQVEALLIQHYPDTEIVVRGLSEFGDLRGITVEVATDSEDEAELKALEQGLIRTAERAIPGATEEYSVEVIGPSLGETFFRQTLMAVLLAFVLMGLVVFFYFGENTKAKIAAVVLSATAYFLFTGGGGVLNTIFLVLIAIGLILLYAFYSPPSAAVILAAFSDIVVTLAIVNLLGVKISTAGVAAFLMLIGYSVDTDILLSTRVLKHRKGTIYESIISSFKTGMLMSVTSITAATIGFFVSQSTTIKQIMLIILIGLIIDIINTWLQNAGIIRMYAERREAAR
ncbi:hypothetical protein GOV07_00195 [Candidatus Woesearchaeota archaeon]|nr:hypothetical protein [Candidatus Woesearchaeota archaeon]